VISCYRLLSKKLKKIKIKIKLKLKFASIVYRCETLLLTLREEGI
jgi:hypothetical protein